MNISIYRIIKNNLNTKYIIQFINLKLNIIIIREIKRYIKIFNNKYINN